MSAEYLTDIYEICLVLSNIYIYILIIFKRCIVITTILIHRRYQNEFLITFPPITRPAEKS